MLKKRMHAKYMTHILRENPLAIAKRDKTTVEV